MPGTPVDSLLVLFEEADITTASTVTHTAIDVHGVDDAELYVAWSSIAGTTPDLLVYLDVSIDNGSNYTRYPFGRNFDENDAPTYPATKFVFSRPVFIPGVPRSDSDWLDRYTPSGFPPDPVKVRLVTTVTGTSSPGPADFEAWLGDRDTGNTSARVV